MRRSVILLALASALAPARAADDEVKSAAKNVRQVIAHRGSMSDRPENTLASLKRAIEVKAHVSEVDVRTTKDGALVCMHDADVTRTTDGKGPVAGMTLEQIKRLDAGARFGPKFKGERVPTFREVLQAARGKIGVMIDLEEDGDTYLERIAAEVREHGEPKRTVLGVRSVGHARTFRKLLPEARQIGLIPRTDDIEAFAAAGVKVIRLWPKWLSDRTLVPRVRKVKLELHLGTGGGTRAEVVPLLAHTPESLSSDDPARLV